MLFRYLLYSFYNIRRIMNLKMEKKLANRMEKTRKIKNFFKNGVFFLKSVLLLAKFCLNLNRKNLIATEVERYSSLQDRDF